MRKRRLIALLQKARHDLDEAVEALMEPEDDPASAIDPDCDPDTARDLAEVQLRVRALEMRVTSIEGRSGAK